MEIVDHPCAAALAAAAAPDANLAQAAGPGNEIAAGRLIGDQVDYRILLVNGEQFFGPPPVAGELDHRNRAARHPSLYPKGVRLVKRKFLLAIGGLLLSPVYADLKGFPPTLLTSGTRDLFLSLTVRTHRKLRRAGVDAELQVFEGLSHAQYTVNADAPETREAFEEIARFLTGIWSGRGTSSSHHLLAALFSSPAPRSGEGGPRTCAVGGALVASPKILSMNAATRATDGPPPRFAGADVLSPMQGA